MKNSKRMLSCAVIGLAFLPISGQAQNYNCDVNGDGEVDIVDVMIVVEGVLNGTTPLSPQRHLTFHVTEEPYTTETGEARNAPRRAPEVTTNTLKQFYINLMYDDGGLNEMTDGSMTYLTNEGHYQNEATWPSISQSKSVTVLAYNNNNRSCYLDDDDNPYLHVELEENSSEQSDVLGPKRRRALKRAKARYTLHSTMPAPQHNSR